MPMLGIGNVEMFDEISLYFFVSASECEIMTVGNTVSMASDSTPKYRLQILLQLCYIYLHKEI